MRRVVTCSAAIAICTLNAAVVLATTAPKNGGPLPPAYRARLARDRTAFSFEHAWVQKARKVREARRAYLAEASRSGLAPGATLPPYLVVGGTIRIPIFAGYFQSQSPPYPLASLQNRLFDNPSGTVTDYYDEVSYGNLDLTGTVYGWDQVSNLDAYYAGSGNGMDPTTDHTGTFIKELLDFHDGAVDFGQYDNDGPDGVPNSGDDDGFVDLVAVVHNEVGGECSVDGVNGNIWSHHGRYRSWTVSGGLPYQTNDARAGGGFIQIDEYTIQPALNCDGSTVIDIGVFCHEFGHAFGLPDLYDIDGGGSGIGHWGIMGSGNWNQPDSPAHPCAWTRAQLGWVVPTPVDWTNAATNIDNIEANPVAFRLPFTEERFRRSNVCAIDGSWSLFCGLSEAEGTARGWRSPDPGGGYGSNWRETVERDFHYTGVGSVSMGYDYRYDTEAGFDSAFAVIEVMGSETIVAAYSGQGSGTASHDLTPYLGALSGVGGDYTLKFRVVSDLAFADDDSLYDSSCGALAVDNVSVTGGGEAYTTDFEAYADGWHQESLESKRDEYWLVENRAATGFDVNLHGEGLLVMHIQDDTMANPFLANSAGDSNMTVRGVVIEEANGDFDLNGPVSNRGEDTDVFPGASNQTSFTSATPANSDDNTGNPTYVSITNISAAGPTMTANLRAGDAPPQAVSVDPDTIDNDEAAISLTVTGNAIGYGATFRFTNPTTASPVEPVPSPLDGGDMVAFDVRWVDPTLLVGNVNAYSKTAGTWDLVVTNADGQSVTVPGALTVNFVVATQLVSATVSATDGAVDLVYELHGREDGETIRLYRSRRLDGAWRVLADDLEGDARGRYRYRDEDVEPGVTYDYRLESQTADGEMRALHTASATIPVRSLSLAQNVPNPFNPTTIIHFYLPERGDVALDVYDVSGAHIRRLAAGAHRAGPHDLRWDGRDDRGNPVASGVYLYRLTTDRRTLTRKMVLLK